jgi:RND superfamily putative drug exporter
MVFASFVLGDLRLIKLFGIGLATAIFIDATIVRIVLVPATMELLGKANWWFPRWLEWIPHVNIEGTPEPAPESGSESAATTPSRDRSPTAS